MLKSICRKVHGFAGIVHHRFAFKNIIIVIELLIAAFLIIEFVFYFSYDLFHDIFQRYYTGSAAKLIYNNCKMYPLVPELLQQVFDKLLLMHEIRDPHKVM